MRALGIDYGTKRIGLALSDEAGIIAHPLMIIKNSSHAIEDIITVCGDKGIDTIVFGKSLNAEGQDNSVAEEAKTFAEKLQTATGLPAQFVHEGFSSFEAARMGRIEKPVANPHRHQYDNGAHDDRAAAVILQRFLDTQK